MSAQLHQALTRFASAFCEPPSRVWVDCSRPGSPLRGKYRLSGGLLLRTTGQQETSVTALRLSGQRSSGLSLSRKIDGYSVKSTKAKKFSPALLRAAMRSAHLPSCQFLPEGSRRVVADCKRDHPVQGAITPSLNASSLPVPVAYSSRVKTAILYRFVVLQRFRLAGEQR